jgi:hypothetical protein
MTALPRWQANVVDQAGNILPLASVEVRNETTAVLASLFSDRGGTTPLANPLTADSEAFVSFFVTPGNYKITAVSGSNTRIWRYVNIGPALDDSTPARFVVGGANWIDDGGSVMQALATDTNAAFSAIRFSADINPSRVKLGKSRGAAIGTNTIVQSGDNLGQISFLGFDGAAYQGAATIFASVDGTPGANDMPGRLVFQTTPDGSATPLTRAQITNDGRVIVGAATQNKSLQCYSHIEATEDSSVSGVFPSVFATWYTNNQFEAGVLAAGRSRGSASSPTYAQTGDAIGFLQFSTNFITAVEVQVFATENHSASLQGTTLFVRNVKNGGGGLQNRLVLNQNGSFTAVDPLGGLGYGGGAGGTVIQGAGAKTNAVTLNKVTGTITMDSAALAAGTIVNFTFNNSAIEATDALHTSHYSGGTIGAYSINGRATGAGTAQITVRNNTAGSLSEAIVIRFAIIKSVDA